MLEATNVILMAVGDDHADNFVAAVDDVLGVRQDDIDAVLGLIREHQAAVDDEDSLAVLDGHHVLADFAKTPEGDDAEVRVLIGHCGDV